MTPVTKYDEEFRAKIKGNGENLSARIDSANSMKKLHQKIPTIPNFLRMTSEQFEKREGRGKAIQSKISEKGDNLSARVISAGMMKTTFPSLYRHPAVRKLRKRLGDEVSKAMRG